MPNLASLRSKSEHPQQYRPPPAHYVGSKEYLPGNDRQGRTRITKDFDLVAGGQKSSRAVVEVQRNEDLSELYALRYRIYCLERGFLCPSNYPNGLESDIEDERSAHFAAKNSASAVIGTARLVLGTTGEPFPVEKHCSTFQDFVPPATSLTAEVSRLAVSKNSGCDVNSPLPRAPLDTRNNSRQRRTNSPTVVLRLYRQMYRYSKEHGICYWYAAMEKSLMRILARYGVVFTPIGPTQDYYGPVSPCIIALEALEQQLETANPALLNWLRLDS